MELTPAQHRALCSICDTFLPAVPGWPSAVERGVPDALGAALDFNPRAVDRWEFLNLLDIWDSSLHSFIEVGSWSQFSALPEADKQKVMLSGADWSAAARRAPKTERDRSGWGVDAQLRSVRDRIRRGWRSRCGCSGGSG